MTVFIVGNQTNSCLEASYRRGFEEQGVRVRTYAIFEHQRNYVRLGTFGKLFHDFVPVEAWQQKLNRELALTIVAEKPDLVLVFGNAPVLSGTLAFVRSLTTIPFVLVWPDPLLNLQAHVQQAALLYDGVATFSRATVPVFEQMQFRHVYWLPLAADPALHGLDSPPNTFSYDLSFVGAWRPEREKALATIKRLFPQLRIGIWGTDWNRCQTVALRSLARNSALRGQAYAQAFNASRINLNVIDDTCYPAANMRFFEIPVAHGLQLASLCPEFQETYRHQEHMLYFSDETQLGNNIEWVLQHPDQAATLRAAGHRQVLQAHTYAHRVAQLIDLISHIRAKP
ncbi:CgeB family protein [Fibrella aquatica]|uniref:CgeB family protein n=1 Tax=Fibrella aquatica TaxID=3242487 RepID=UPI003522959E